MVRPRINLEPFKDVIVELRSEEYTAEQIAVFLQSEYNINVKSRTIGTRLQQWGIRRRIIASDTPELRASIAILFRLNCTDEEMLIELQESGINIEITQLARIRRDLGLVRRMTINQRKEVDSQLFELLTEEVKDGRIEGYGRRLLYTYFKTKGHSASRYFPCFHLLHFVSKFSKFHLKRS
jgi:tRNA threonylcarbamoyladenosine modification (KEOPS) complex  Pcc1 subunit